MSHIYENDTKPILSDPPYPLQFILAVVLLCSAERPSCSCGTGSLFLSDCL